jgi:DNA-binding MarR family transcriptional regulator
MGSHAVREAAPAATTSGARALDAIRRIVRTLRISSSALQRELGVSGAQLYVLKQLAEAPADSIGVLAARTMTDHSSVSVVVSRLADRGLVSRAQSNTDARRMQIALTAKGRALLARAPDPAQERLVDALAGLGRPELDSLAAGLERLVGAMGAEEEKPAMFFEDEGGKSAPRRKRQR